MCPGSRTFRLPSLSEQRLPHFSSQNIKHQQESKNINVQQENMMSSNEHVAVGYPVLIFSKEHVEYTPL